MYEPNGTDYDVDLLTSYYIPTEDEVENEKLLCLRQVFDEDLNEEDKKLYYILLSSSPQKFLSSLLGLRENKFVYRRSRLFKILKCRVEMKLFRKKNPLFDSILSEILTKKQLSILRGLERCYSIPLFCKRYPRRVSGSKKNCSSRSVYYLRLRIMKRLGKISKKSPLVGKYFQILKSFWRGKRIKDS